MSAAPLGLVAGAGRLPLLAARSLRRAGREVVTAQLAETGQNALGPVSDACASFSLGQVGTIIAYMKDHGVRELLYLGKVEKSLNFASIKFDEVALSMVMRLPDRKDHSLFGVLADEMVAHGFTIVAQTAALSELVTPAGHLGGPEPDAAQRQDIERGMAVARAVAAQHVGQTVVVKQGAVAAVEAFEHTDATIRRAGKLAGKNTVVAKVAWPDQDPRFDVPAWGTQTLAVMRRAGASCLAVEAGTSLMIEPQRVRSYAARFRITLMGI